MLNLRRLALPSLLLSPTLLACLVTGCSSRDTGLYEGDDGGASAPASGGEGSGVSEGDPSGSASGTAGDTAAGTTGAEPPDDPSDEGGSDESGSSGSSGGEAPACDDETPVVLFLSPDDSNSTSSPVQVRAAARAGGYLGNVPIRTWEFLNYYSFDYPGAESGTVIVTPQLARVGDSKDAFTLQIGVSSEQIANADRPLMNITLVLDESGSMEGKSMDMQKAACRALIGSLRKGDVVSMVGWDTENAIKLEGHVVTGPNDPALLAEIDALAAGGGTDLNGGLIAGYALAHKQFNQDRINRVVLISDGGANAGVTDIDLISGGAGAQDKDGIYLVGVGVGESDYYNDTLMDAVTDAGRGASLFIPSEEEANKMFGERFVSTMAVAVRDVQVQLDMPPGFKIVKFSGEEFSSDPTQIEPQHLAPNDAMVFHQTLSTCAPNLGEAAELKVTARYRDAKNFAAKETSETLLIGDALAESSPQLLKGAAVFQYAESLKIVRDGDETERAIAIAVALTAIDAADTALPGDADLAEIRSVLADLGASP